MTWLVAMPRARGQACEVALRKAESSSVHALECRELHSLDDALRGCTAPAATPRSDRLGLARWEVTVALRRCSCANVLDAADLARRLAATHSALGFAQLTSAVGQAKACVGEDARDQRRLLDKLDAEIEQLKNSKSYCSSPGMDVDRVSRAPAGTCHDARLRRTALEYWVSCSNGNASSDPRLGILETMEAQVCGASVKPLTCDATLAIADRLRQSSADAAERQLWNLVATQLLAAAGPRATRDDRECATRMIATAVPDSAVSDRMDRSTVESLIRDPELRDRFVAALRDALKDSGEAEQLAKLLAEGADLRQVLQQASRLTDDERRRFFSVAGGLGRAIQAVRALSAFEQTARGFDVVIAPKPKRCKYADFINVLLAGLSKAMPAQIAIVESEHVTGTVDDLVAARVRSCGTSALAAAAGPGCGAVIAIQLEDRDANRGAGQAHLHFVAPNGSGGAAHRQTTAVQIGDFQVGCGANSEESAAALRLVFNLQFAFATNPRDTAIVLDRPVRTELCGLRALPPSDLPTAVHDRKGLRIQGPELDTKLAGPADGAREALRAWTYGVGEIDANNATANLRFSSARYRDDQGNQGDKIEADLTLHGRRAASFAAVVLGNDPGCHAPVAERYVQAGRMIGNEVGSFLASQDLRDPSRVALTRRPRWILPVGAAVGEVALIGGGLILINSAVQGENTAAAHSLDPTMSNNRLAWGRGLLVTAAIGAVAMAIYAAAN